MEGLTIRRAVCADAAAIAGIYNHYVLNTTVTFDEVPKSAEDREQWLADHDDCHPVLVAELAGQIVGWGALTRWAVRPAWASTAEVAVYLATDTTGRGIGPAILDQLIIEAERAGLHVLLSQITAENGASIKMAERAGFHHAGRLGEVGWKFGNWLDVVLLQKTLTPPAEEPS